MRIGAPILVILEKLGSNFRANVKIFSGMNPAEILIQGDCVGTRERRDVKSPREGRAR
jgi:hypothetical protein